MNNDEFVDQIAEAVAKKLSNHTRLDGRLRDLKGELYSFPHEYVAPSQQRFPLQGFYGPLGFHINAYTSSGEPVLRLELTDFSGQRRAFIEIQL